MSDSGMDGGLDLPAHGEAVQPKVLIEDSSDASASTVPLAPDSAEATLLSRLLQLSGRPGEAPLSQPMLRTARLLDYYSWIDDLELYRAAGGTLDSYHLVAPAVRQQLSYSLPDGFLQQRGTAFETSLRSYYMPTSKLAAIREFQTIKLTKKEILQPEKVIAFHRNWDRTYDRCRPLAIPDSALLAVYKKNIPEPLKLHLELEGKATLGECKTELWRRCHELYEHQCDVHAFQHLGEPVAVAAAAGSPATCEHCGKQGHDQTTCYKRVPCPKCGQLGHGARRCRNSSAPTIPPQPPTAPLPAQPAAPRPTQSPVRSSDKDAARRERHKDLTCHGCGEKGHIKPFCPKREDIRWMESMQRLDEADSIDLLRPTMPMILTSGSGTTVPLAAFLDSGSVRNYISTALFARLQAAGGVFAQPYSGQATLGDQTTAEINHRVHITLTASQFLDRPVTFECDALVMNTRDDMILGTETMVSLGFNKLLAGHDAPTPLSLSQEDSLVSPILEDERYHDDPALRDGLQRIIDESQDVLRDQILQEPAATEAAEIHTDGPLPAPASGSRRLSAQKLDFLDKFIAEGLELDLLEPVVDQQTPVLFNLVFAKKGDSYRVCVDFTPLNKVTVPYNYPLQNMKDLLSKAVGHDYYAILDLKSGFHQIPLKEAHRYLTAFVCPRGIFRFKRVPEGLRNASGFFQRIMTGILEDYIDKSCLLFIDDILIYADTVEDYLQAIRDVLQALRRKRLICSLKKAKFGLSRAVFLGHTVSKDGLGICDSRKQGIVDMLPPTGRDSLASYLATVNFLRDFMGFDALQHIRPLSLKMKKGVVWTWTADDQQRFDCIKKLVLAAPLLHIPDPRADLLIRCDASDIGCAGLLLNKYDSGEEALILCVSKSFTSSEANWSIMDKEMYAIYYTIMKAEYFLDGVHFIVETDNRNLIHLASSRSPRVIRLRANLQDKLFSVLHIRGKDNPADYFSRALPDCRKEALEPPQPSTLCRRLVQTSQTRANRRQELLHKVHNGVAGHQGEKPMKAHLDRLGENWPERSRDVHDYVQSCTACQYQRLALPALEAKVSTTKASFLWEIVAVDTCEVMDGYVHTYRCCFSGWTQLEIAETKEAVEVARTMLRVFGNWGAPLKLRSDNGTEFTAAVIVEFCKLLRIDQQFTLAHRPQANGVVERGNGLFLTHLRTLLFDTGLERDWRLYLPIVQRIMNSFINTSTGFTPADCLFGTRLNLNKIIYDHTGADSQTDAASPFVPTTDWVAAYSATHERLLLKAADLLAEAVSKRLATSPAEPTTFLHGTPVLVRPVRGRGPTKLARRMMGPYVVASQEGNIVIVRDLVNDSLHRYHTSRVKPYDASRTPDLQQLAARGAEEYRVETVLHHRHPVPGSTSLKNMEVLLHWAGYDSSEDTWEPYWQNRNVAAIKDYVATTFPAAPRPPPTATRTAPPRTTGSGRVPRPPAHLQDFA